MKKMVIGIIIGAVLSFSGQALAETISNIGKKVSNEYPVFVEVKQLPDKAIEVDGKLYIPSGAVDAIGYAVRLKDDTVIIRKKFAMTGDPPLRESK